MTRRFDRRTFMRRSAVVTATGTVIAAGAASGQAADPPAALVASILEERVPFEGLHQAGIATPRQPHAIFIAMDSIAGSQADLSDALRTLSVRSRVLTSGASPAPALSGVAPDSGILGPSYPPDRLTVTVALGASLFDGRYGLRARKPRALTAMTTFPDDQLDPAECHGDVLVQLCSGSIDTNLHALRELMRTTRGALAARWKIEGFVPPDRSQRGHPETGRNLLGFKDGIVNPSSDELDRLVWVGDDELPWTRGGTYVVLRIIRNRVEFWDRVPLREQETMIGRRKDSGAPLSGGQESDRAELRRRSEGRHDRARRAHPARQPAHDGDRR